MRDKMAQVICDLAEQDPNVLLVTADLGFGVLDQFRQQFPAQFINAGVAEQNMTGLATGLALEGKIVFTYSIGNFPTLRCLEQIRNDACYHGANVKIIAIGGGFTYGSLGISHHATEDLAIMRALPDITVLAPGDPLEAEAATRAIYKQPGTCYLRLGRGGEPRVHKDQITFILGEALKVKDYGHDVVIISTGGILKNAADACDMLAEKGIGVQLYSMHTMKPFDNGLISRIAPRARLVVTIEEHTIIGGLGSAVAVGLAQSSGNRARLLQIGLNDCFSSVVGDQEYLRGIYGLSVEAIMQKIQEALLETSN
jgi:transketolase